MHHVQGSEKKKRSASLIEFFFATQGLAVQENIHRLWRTSARGAGKHEKKRGGKLAQSQKFADKTFWVRFWTPKRGLFFGSGDTRSWCPRRLGLVQTFPLGIMEIFGDGFLAKSCFCQDVVQCERPFFLSVCVCGSSSEQLLARRSSF